ncbi:hypothetical protein BB560_004403 [Smittium megazygosporum]|uniref:SAP domain-containing protein n=1 Tax=Smittium megazygosporum TaxID=133381 RepID=A0A2T9Z9D3_9FUNG|nr:hypothetical protein BB560_004403 [Smittium megazygosporum]
MEEYSEKSLKKLKVPELKQILSNFNISCDGKKDDLISKILAHQSSAKKEIPSSSSLPDDTSVPSKDSEGPYQSKPTIEATSESTTQSSMKPNIEPTEKKVDIPTTSKIDSSEVPKPTDANPIDLATIRQMDEQKRMEIRSKKFGIAQTDDQRKQGRLDRFGSKGVSSNDSASQKSVPTKLSPSLNVSGDVLAKRAMKFGLPLKRPSESITSNTEDAEKLEKRKQRFENRSAPESTKKAESTSEDQDKLKKRAIRFGISS